MTELNCFIKLIFFLKIESKFNFSCDFYVIDITKIIRDLGYETINLNPESEFILNHSIRNKITQGIYSTKCDSILVCYRNMPPDFKSNLEEFLEEFPETIDYAIHNL